LKRQREPPGRNAWPRFEIKIVLALMRFEPQRGPAVRLARRRPRGSYVALPVFHIAT
jgi:hypothetical protein